LLYVSEDLSEAFVETVRETQSDATDSYLAALNRCKGKLAVEDEELLTLRYVEDLNTRQIAERMGRAQASICHSLARIRRWLFGCIHAELERQEQVGRELS
jgi:DNA-directed RNA polymerase specialized sigma24 family protein